MKAKILYCFVCRKKTPHILVGVKRKSRSVISQDAVCLTCGNKRILAEKKKDKIIHYCRHCNRKTLQLILIKELMDNKDNNFYRTRCFECNMFNVFLAHDKDLKYEV